MFDLVRAIRSGDTHRQAPIVCVRGRPGFTAITSRTAGNAALRATVESYIKA